MWAKSIRINKNPQERKTNANTETNFMPKNISNVNGTKLKRNFQIIGSCMEVLTEKLKIAFISELHFLTWPISECGDSNVKGFNTQHVINVSKNITKIINESHVVCIW